MEYKRLNKSRSLNYLLTSLVVGCLFLAQSAFSQNTDEPCCDADTNDIEEAVEIYPSPDTKEISVALTLLDQSDVTVSLVNLKGKKIQESRKKINLIPGNTILNYRVSNLRQGAYLLMAEIDGYIHTRIVNIQKSKSKQVNGNFFSLRIASFSEI